MHTDPRLARIRTLLFAPGNDQHKLDKAPTLGSDAVVFDLEDAVPASKKDTARELVHETLAATRPSLPVLVRINGPDTDHVHADLEAAVTAHTVALVVPKVESPVDLLRISRLIADLEASRKLEPGSISVLALLETAAGIEAAAAVCQAGGTRLRRTILGTVDLARDLGLAVGERNPPLTYAAARLVMAARAAGLPPPLDGPYTHLNDDSGYEQDCRESAAAGMAGRVILHPSQVAAAHDAYGEASTIEWHERVVTAFETAERAGTASLQLDGQFIDYPVYLASRRALERQ